MRAFVEVVYETVLFHDLLNGFYIVDFVEYVVNWLLLLFWHIFCNMFLRWSKKSTQKKKSIGVTLSL